MLPLRQIIRVREDKDRPHSKAEGMAEVRVIVVQSLEPVGLVHQLLETQDIPVEDLRDPGLILVNPRLLLPPEMLTYPLPINPKCHHLDQEAMETSIPNRDIIIKKKRGLIKD